MSFFKATWWRPVTALAVLALAVGVLSVGGRGTALADSPATVTIDPAAPPDIQLGAGTSTTVNVKVTPPAGHELSIWIVKISYDPAVVEVPVNGSLVSCSALDTSNLPGDAKVAGGCDITASGDHGTADDTAVAFGAYLRNNNNTAEGLSGTQTVASFTFKAKGNVGDSTPLHVTVPAHSLLGPDAADYNDAPGSPAVTIDGGIEVITPVGTSRIWGDGDCSGAVSPVDSLKTLRTDAGIAPTQTVTGCPAWGSNVTVNGITVKWGDIDCSGSVSPVDSLKVLKTDAGVPPAQTVANCPAMGSTVQVS
jgi:hypothetical protein